MRFELKHEGKYDLNVFEKVFLFCFLYVYSRKNKEIGKYNMKWVIGRFPKP